MKQKILKVVKHPLFMLICVEAAKVSIGCAGIAVLFVVAVIVTVMGL